MVVTLLTAVVVCVCPPSPDHSQPHPHAQPGEQVRVVTRTGGWARGHRPRRRDVWVQEVGARNAGGEMTKYPMRGLRWYWGATVVGVTAVQPLLGHPACHVRRVWGGQCNVTWTDRLSVKL